MALGLVLLKSVAQPAVEEGVVVVQVVCTKWLKLK